MLRQLAIVLLTFCLLISQSAQNRAQTPVKPPQEKTGEDDVVRITTNLVQVEVTVTDKDGRLVTDLTAACLQRPIQRRLSNPSVCW